MSHLFSDEMTEPGGRAAISRLSFHSIFAGVVLGLACEATLLVLGSAFGLSVFSPRTGDAQGLGIGLYIWLLFTLCVSSFVGAWMATLVSRTLLRREGLIHGAIVWASLALVGLFFVSGLISSIAGGAASMLKTGAMAAAQQPGAVQQPLAQAQQQLSQPETREQLREGALQAYQGARAGLWGLFFALLLPLGTALAGGVVGLTSERRLRARRATVTREVREEIRPGGPIIPQPT